MGWIYLASPFSCFWISERVVLSLPSIIVTKSLNESLNANLLWKWNVFKKLKVSATKFSWISLTLFITVRSVSSLRKFDQKRWVKNPSSSRRCLISSLTKRFDIVTNKKVWKLSWLCCSFPVFHLFFQTTNNSRFELTLIHVQAKFWDTGEKGVNEISTINHGNSLMVSKRKSSEGSGSAPVSNDTEAETELLKMSLNLFLLMQFRT